jgi:hypothetical protein
MWWYRRVEDAVGEGMWPPPDRRDVPASVLVDVVVSVAPLAILAAGSVVAVVVVVEVIVIILLAPPLELVVEATLLVLVVVVCGCLLSRLDGVTGIMIGTEMAFDRDVDIYGLVGLLCRGNGGGCSEHVCEPRCREAELSACCTTAISRSVLSCGWIPFF